MTTGADDGLASAQIGSLRIGYRRRGSGPPLLILPGALDESRWWARQLSDLADDCTVIVWDAPGCGISSDPPPDWSLADFADCVAALVAELGVAPVHLLGLSFGGALALEVWGRHPAIVRSLLLVSAYAGWVGSLGPEEAAARVAAAEGMPGMTPDEIVTAWGPAQLGAVEGAERDRLELLVRDTRTVAAPTLARALAVDLRPVLPTVAVPALVVHGTDDPRAPRPVADALAAAIPGAELAVVTGAGHLVNVDAPRRFATVVRGFLAARAGA